jgi:hypothetical protein
MNYPKQMSIKLAVFAVLSVCLTNVGLAIEVTIDATAVGFIRRVPGATYKHFAQDGYLVGSQGNGLLHTDNNNYFVFDMSAVTGTITSATLRMYTSDERTDVPEGGYWSSSGSEQLILREVTTNAATLKNFTTTQFNNGTPQFTQLDTMFNDLGSGPTFGSVEMTEASAEVQPGTVPGQPGGKIWDIPLNVMAVNSLNDSSALWAVGGSLADTSPAISSTTELLFGGSVPFSTVPGRATPIPQLVLTINPGLSADFDGDGDVDGRDFLIWQRGYGSAGQTNNSLGDADGNGTVGDEDLTFWQEQYNTVSLNAAFSSVPEPSSGLLLLWLAATGISWRRIV